MHNNDAFKNTACGLVSHSVSVYCNLKKCFLALTLVFAIASTSSKRKKATSSYQQEFLLFGFKLSNADSEMPECLNCGLLVSFDVVSLFTSVPVDHAIDIVVNLLDCDDSLSSRTQLSSQDIKTGLEICSKSTLLETFYIVKLSALPWVLAFLLF